MDRNVLCTSKYEGISRCASYYKIVFPNLSPVSVCFLVFLASVTSNIVTNIPMLLKWRWSLRCDVVMLQRTRHRDAKGTRVVADHCVVPGVENGGGPNP